MPIQRKVNEIFFDSWNPEMAYVLGFIFADGYVHTNKRGSAYLGFVSTDLEIVKKIKTVMGSNHKISFRSRKKENPNWKDCYRLQIGNKHILEKLRDFGVIQNKSLTIRLPNEVPEKVFGDFLRGYFDGDGCVYFKKHRRKNAKKKTWVFTSRFTSGSKLFLLDIHRALTPWIKGGFIVDKERGYELVFSNQDSLALYQLMYNNIPGNLFLGRKYRTFKKAVTTLRMIQYHSPLPNSS